MLQSNPGKKCYFEHITEYFPRTPEYFRRTQTPAGRGDGILNALHLVPFLVVRPHAKLRSVAARQKGDRVFLGVRPHAKLRSVAARQRGDRVWKDDIFWTLYQRLSSHQFDIFNCNLGRSLDQRIGPDVQTLFSEKITFSRGLTGAIVNLNCSRTVRVTLSVREEFKLKIAPVKPREKVLF